MAIQNVFNDFARTPKTFFSAGLHPWYITEEWRSHFILLEKAVSDRRALAIGECGLDRTSITNWSMQLQAFTEQVMLANNTGKPLIVHCVRAYEEILQLLVKLKNRQPVIFHGYNKNWHTAERILGAGHWLSFGKALEQLQVQQVFFQTPVDRFFLETDDSDLDIEKIYGLAADIKSMPMNELLMQLEMNFEKLFKIPLR